MSIHPRSNASDILPGEPNYDYCLRYARGIDKDDLIRCLLAQIATMRKRSEKNLPLWSFVGAATSHGCGISTAIVEVYVDKRI